MVTDSTDISLTSDGDDEIKNGDFAVGDSRLDDCYAIFKLNTASLKSDPVLAPNLIMLINSKAGSGQIKTALRLNLERDNQKYKTLNVKNGVIEFEI